MKGQPIKKALVVFMLTTLAAVTSAHAGTCRIHSEGSDTVEVCGDAREDYSATVTGRHGHKRQFGEPNGGFERYPGQGRRPATSCQLTLGASSKQVFHILLQIRDDLMMAFNHMIPRQWGMGENTALSEKLNVLEYVF
jgi:hypothetical protein